MHGDEGMGFLGAWEQRMGSCKANVQGMGAGLAPFSPPSSPSDTYLVVSKTEYVHTSELHSLLRVGQEPLQARRDMGQLRAWSSGCDNTEGHHNMDTE